jgi:putative transposase
MPLPEEIFDALGQAKVFSTLDLRFGYHQLPLREDDKVKTTFWRIDPHGKDCLYQWKFLSFGLKNALTKFQRVMDQVLAGLNFTKCYINDIIVFSLTPRDHMHHLQEVFGKLKEHYLTFHLDKCWFFHTEVKYLDHMIYLDGLGVQKAKVEAIS